MGKAEERRRERQVTLLRKPGPVSATLFQRIGKEWVPPDDQPTLATADIDIKSVRRNS